MSNLNFSFHESFPAQTIYLSELLKLASENYSGNKYEISNITGIPTGDTSGKVEPHIRYLEYMGLMTSYYESGKINIRLTQLGKVIFQEDPFLMQDVTKRLLHYNLCRINIGAPQWSFLFRDYPYDFNTPIKLSNIIDNGKLIFGKEIYLSALKSLYNNGDFSSISPVEFIDKDIIFKNCYINYECRNVYAYTLLKEIEDKKLENCEVTIDIILEEIKWQKGFGFDYETTIEVLDDLNHMGIIKFNKQLDPMTIITNRNSEDIIAFLYDSLI